MGDYDPSLSGENMCKYPNFLAIWNSKYTIFAYEEGMRPYEEGTRPSHLLERCDLRVGIWTASLAYELKALASRLLLRHEIRILVLKRDLRVWS